MQSTQIQGVIEDLFRSTGTEVVPGQVAVACSISAATAARALEELVNLGRVERSYDGAYRPHESGCLARLVDGGDAETAANAVLRTLALTSGADAYIAIADRGEVICVDYMSVRPYETHSTAVGERFGHSSAAGVLFGITRQHAAESRFDGMASPIVSESGSTVAVIGTVSVDPRAEMSAERHEQLVGDAASAAAAAITRICPLEWWRTRMLAATGLRNCRPSGGAWSGDSTTARTRPLLSDAVPNRMLAQAFN